MLTCGNRTGILNTEEILGIRLPKIGVKAIRYIYIYIKVQFPKPFNKLTPYKVSEYDVKILAYACGLMN